jgi:hypothetical protein
MKTRTLTKEARIMRPSNLLVTVFALCLSLTGQQTALADVGRTVMATYQAPAMGNGSVTGFCAGPSTGIPTQSCVREEPQSGEDNVDATVTDGLGVPVFSTIGQDLNGDGVLDTKENFCGTITEFEIEDEAPVYVIP